MHDLLARVESMLEEQKDDIELKVKHAEDQKKQLEAEKHKLEKEKRGLSVVYYQRHERNLISLYACDYC